MASSLLVRNAQGASCRAACPLSSSRSPEERVFNHNFQSFTWLGKANAVRRRWGPKGQRRSLASLADGQLHLATIVSMQNGQAETSETVEEPQRAFDVSSNCVTPSFRSAPWQGTNNEASWQAPALSHMNFMRPDLLYHQLPMPINGAYV